MENTFLKFLVTCYFVNLKN
uniref:Uncharacterized protein n=1 Tax=Anguilla anguilla TaxID=7936 RepID=A0A0E9XFP0_ANGAN